METITIFGSSQCKKDSADYKLAYEIGSRIGKMNLRLCNGGYGGTMEATAQGAREQGGKTIGITLSDAKSKANAYIDEERARGSYWDRLEELMKEADAYIILKGGFGSLVELAWLIESMLKKTMRRKPVLLYENFWKPVIENMKQEIDVSDPGFPDARPSELDSLIHYFKTADDVNSILSKFF